MAKGDQAKAAVVAKLKEVFGNDYIGEYSKKYYVWSKDGGERVQIAISLTCPKVPVEVSSAPVTGDYNFEDDVPTNVVAAAPYQPADITPEERARVAELMAKLGL